MPFCPQCGYEHQEGVTSCPDCGQSLADRPPERPASTTAGWPPAQPPAPRPEESSAPPEAAIVVYEAPDAALSNAVKTALEEAGIPVTEDVFHHPLTSQGLDIAIRGSYSRLLVAQSLAQEAKRISAEFLAAYQHGDLALTPEEAAQAGPEAPVKEHRGVIILILGILGLVFSMACIGIVLGAIAWIMGNRDLDEMRHGTMDPAGKDLTSAGRICAIVAVILTAALFAYVMVAIALFSFFLPLH